MSQVISRANPRNPESTKGEANSWRKPVLIIFHGVVSSTYGFAICWQNVSTASAQLYLRSNPAMRVFGKWRFLTYQCLVIQFVAFSLCLTSHFVPKLRRLKDYFFTSIAFPVGMTVVTSFWGIWFIAGRENIFPDTMEAFYPPWLNHVTHTIIAPINLAELVFVRHSYLSDRKAYMPLLGYIFSYTSFLLYIRFQTGRFVYPFLNKMDAIPVGAYIVGLVVYTVFIYKSGKYIHNLIHGVKSLKGACMGKQPKKL